jgi:hypothetical protein
MSHNNPFVKLPDDGETYSANELLALTSIARNRQRAAEWFELMQEMKTKAEMGYYWIEVSREEYRLLDSDDFQDLIRLGYRIEFFTENDERYFRIRW